MASNDTNNGERQNGNEGAGRKRRRRTLEERIEAQNATVARAQEVLKNLQSEKKMRDERVAARDKEREEKRNTRRKIVSGALFLDRVEQGDVTARQVYSSLRRTVEARDVPLFEEFDQKVAFSEWGSSADTSEPPRVPSTGDDSRAPA